MFIMTPEIVMQDFKRKEEIHYFQTDHGNLIKKLIKTNIYQANTSQKPQEDQVLTIMDTAVEDVDIYKFQIISYY